MTDQTLHVESLAAAPGERTTGVLTVPISGSTVEVPLILVNGRSPGPRVAITGGIHGAEYVGIEATRRMGMETDPAQLSGSLVVVPISNTTAFFRRSIYTSGLDANNLNRMFPGARSGDPAQALADWLFRTIIRPSDFYIDMHGGDMIEALAPFVIYLGTADHRVEQASRQMAIATGIPRIIRSETPGSTYGAASTAGIPAILAEIGGQGVWNEDEVQRHADGALRVLRHLNVLPGGIPQPDGYREYETFAWMRAEVDGLWYPGVHVGDVVRQGEKIGWIGDYFGNELQAAKAVTSGEVVFLVTSLAINAGDPLLAIGA